MSSPFYIFILSALWEALISKSGREGFGLPVIINRIPGSRSSSGILIYCAIALPAANGRSFKRLRLYLFSAFSADSDASGFVVRKDLFDSYGLVALGAYKHNLA